MNGTLPDRHTNTNNYSLNWLFFAIASLVLCAELLATMKCILPVPGRQADIQRALNYSLTEYSIAIVSHVWYAEQLSEVYCTVHSTYKHK